MNRPYVYQAIITKYLGPTNTRGSRIKAMAAAGSITLPVDDSLNIEQRHAKAAEALCRKFGWNGSYYQGGMPGDDGYCFVAAAFGKLASDPAFVV